MTNLRDRHPMGYNEQHRITQKPELNWMLVKRVEKFHYDVREIYECTGTDISENYIGINKNVYRYTKLHHYFNFYE